MVVCACINSPPTMMTKSRLPKRTCVPRTQLTLWLAIRGLVWNAQRPYLVRQLSVFQTSTG